MKNLSTEIHNLAITGGASAVAERLIKIIADTRRECMLAAQQAIIDSGIPIENQAARSVLLAIERTQL